MITVDDPAIQRLFDEYNSGRKTELENFIQDKVSHNTLVAMGADNKQHCVLLEAAIQKGYVDIVNLLLEQDVVRQNLIHTENAIEHCDALELAAKKGHLAIVKSLAQIDQVKKSHSSIAEAQKVAKSIPIEQLDKLDEKSRNERKEIQTYIAKTLKVAKKKALSENNLLMTFRLSQYRQDSKAIDNHINTALQKNTFISKDADGKKHCDMLEYAIESDNVGLIEKLLKIQSVSAGAEEAAKIARKKGKAALATSLDKLKDLYVQSLQNDLQEKQKAESSLAGAFRMSTINLNAVGEFLDKTKKTLVHTDADGNDHCYILEFAVRTRNQGIMEALFKSNQVKENVSVLKQARKIERVAKDKAAFEKAALQRGEGALGPDERAKKIAQLDQIIKEHAITDTQLSTMLKELMDSDKKQKKQSLKNATIQSIQEVPSTFQKQEELALQDALLRTQTGGVRALYKKADTPETRHDKENFKATYNAVEAKTKSERNKNFEQFQQYLIHLRNLVQKEGVKTAIQIGGVVAIGVTSGGIGVGFFFLGKVIALGVDKAHDAWLAKYHVLIEEYKKYFNDPNVLLLQEQGLSLERLELLRDQAEGNDRILLDAQIKTLLDSIQKLQDLERQAEKMGMELLADLMCSTDEPTRKEAERFLNGLHQDTRTLKEKGEKAFDRFRDVAKDVTENALKKNANATQALRTIQPLQQVNAETYSTLVYNVIASQGFVSDTVDSLEDSYRVLAEVQRREALFVKLAATIRERQNPSSATRQAAISTGALKPELHAKERATETGLAVTEESLNLSAQAAQQFFDFEGIASGLIGGAKVLKEKGLLRGVQDQEFIRYIAKLTSVYGVSTLLTRMARESGAAIAAKVETAGDLASADALEAYRYLSENLTEEILSGLPAAQLANGLSPASACTMLTLLLYTGIHDAWYTKKLQKQLEEIIKLQNAKNISQMSEQELMQVVQLVGKTIHEFAKLLPKEMGKHLESAEKLPLKEAENARARDLAELEFSFKRAIIPTSSFAPLSLADIRAKPKLFSETIVYIVQSRSNANNFSAYYHDGNEWCEKDIPKTEFDKMKTGMKSTSTWEFDDAEDVKKIAALFGCTRGPSKTRQKELDKEQLSLDKSFQKMKKVQANEQALYYLTSLYRKMIVQLSTKNRTESRNLAFELLRQSAWVSILEQSKINKADPKALPLIKQYLEIRADRIGQLTYLKLLGTASPDQINELNKYEKEYSEDPFAFLKGINISQLETLVQDLGQANVQLLPSLNLPQNMQAKDIDDVLSMVSKFEFLVQAGRIDPSSNALKEFKLELKTNTVNLEKFKAYLHSIEKLDMLEASDSKTFNCIVAKKKVLWESIFAKSINITAALEKVDSFSKKIERLNNIRDRMLAAIDDTAKNDPLISDIDRKRMKEDLAICVAECLTDVENDDISFEQFSTKAFDISTNISTAATVRNLDAEQKFQELYKEVIRKVNNDKLTILKTEMQNKILTDYIDKKMQSLTLNDHQSFDLYATRMKALDAQLFILDQQFKTRITKDPAHYQEYADKQADLVKKLADKVQNASNNVKFSLTLDFNFTDYVEKMKKFDSLVDDIETRVKTLITNDPAMTASLEAEKNTLIEHLRQNVQNDTVSAQLFNSLSYKPQATSPLKDLETQIVNLKPPIIFSSAPPRSSTPQPGSTPSQTPQTRRPNP